MPSVYNFKLAEKHYLCVRDRTKSINIESIKWNLAVFESVRNVCPRKPANGTEFCHTKDRRVGVKLCEHCLQGSPN